MKSLSTVFIFILTALVTAAQAEITISSGGKGGAYFERGGELALRIGGVNKDSPGSRANMERIIEGSAQVVFTQADELKRTLDDHPGLEQKIDILGSMGKECAHLIGCEDCKVGEEDDLEQGVTLAVGRDGGGTYSTWQFARTLEPDYKGVKTEFVGGASALTKLLSGQVHAVLAVMKPEQYGHAIYKAVNENEKLHFIDFDDYDLNDDLPGGEPVYTFEKIDTYDGFGGGIKTICTQAMVVASKDLEASVTEEIASWVLSLPSED